MNDYAETFRLTSKQLIYLFALLESKGCPGITADWLDQPEPWIRHEMNNQQNQLEVKGILEADFDGEVRINPILKHFIATASACNAYYCQVVEKDEVIQSTSYYFFNESNIYELTCMTSSEEYEIRIFQFLHEYQLHVLNHYAGMETEPEEGTTMVVTLMRIDQQDDEKMISREWVALRDQDGIWKIDKGEDETSTKVTALSYLDMLNELSVWTATI